VTLVNQREDVHVDAMGTVAIGRNSRVQRDTIFRIASLTKPVTAVAAMILVEECKVRLDETVDRLLPELANRKVLRRLDGPLDDTVPAKRAITVRDFLTFTWGFGVLYAPPDGYPILKTANDLQIGVGPPQPLKTPRPDEWMHRLGTLPLMSQPGEMWIYNTGSDALGVLIARASGKPLEVFLRERIFEPLGMKDTSFSVPPYKLKRFATAYWNSFQTGKLEVYDEAATGRWTQPPAFPSGSGGLVSTADDYFAFSRMMLNKGKHNGVRMLSGLLSRNHDYGSANSATESGVGFNPRLFRQSRMGIRRVHRYTAYQPSRARGYVRVERRLGYFVERRPEKRFGRHSADAACLDFAAPTRGLPGFRDAGVWGAG